MHGATASPRQTSAGGATTTDSEAVVPGAGWTRRGWRAWWPVLVPLVIVLVGAWIYRWVDEDAFIDFRVVHNLLAGHGPVFNVGERVEVDSDPLWMGTLAAVHALSPWASLEWTSVVLGLVCTAGAFVAGGAAGIHLAARRDEGTVLPLGLLVVSVVAGVWEFMTSGLEMSMVFLWLGLSYLLVVRVAARQRGAARAALVAGLGPLVRPELALGSAVFVVVLIALVVAPAWTRAHPSGAGRGWRATGVVLAAVAVPAAYQLFRMAYYALWVPTTGLAKEAGTSWWSQGATYLWNFVAPYALWIPLGLAAVLVASRARRWWAAGDRTGVVLLACPLAVGLLDLLYVVGIGGDYMHARLLLPAFFAVSLPVAVPVGQLRTWRAVPVGAVVVWSVVCLGWLRFVPPVEHNLGIQTVFISNERNSWITATGTPHPVTAADYGRALSGRAGAALAALAHRAPGTGQRLVVVTDPFRPVTGDAVRPARSPLPFTLAVNLPAIGVIGYLVGPDVYVYDEFSLANPVGSHTTVAHHARPGHEKLVGPSWMLGRFGVAGSTAVPGGPSAVEVAAARTALACDPLRSYLRAITAPLTWSRALANIGDSLGYTTFRFSPDPVVAARQLCGAHRTGP